MYLSELQLHGFKSFANKTAVKFDSGITAVVGPNGCGKSNIVDALRWVLGEQRTSMLRSSAMQNVIFNGTSSKKALGMAEVSLTIENDKAILPVEYTSVTISRRLYRSGESEYLLNGTVCRLRDIIDLFMDTGMGPGAYSVIELKMVEDILSDKNNDRRRLFEEAAGVTRYKEKRRQTLKKLEDTVADMLRVDDILVEIRKKTRSLQIQAGKARRTKEYAEQLHSLDLGWSRYEYDRIQQLLEPLRDNILEAEKEKKSLSQKFTSLEEAEVLARQKLSEKEAFLVETSRKRNEVASAYSETETNLKITLQNIENEKQVILNYERDIEQAETDIRDLVKQKEKLAGVIDEHAKKLEQAIVEVESFQQNYDSIDAEVKTMRQESQNLNQKEQQFSRQITELKTLQIRFESRIENAGEERARLLQRKEEAEDNVSVSEGEASLLKKRLTEAKTELDTLKSTLEKLSKEKEEAQEKLEVSRDNLRKLKSNADSVKAEIQLLKQIADSQEALPGSVQYVLKEFESNEKIHVLTDIISIEDTYAVALEAALGEVCNYIVVDTKETAQTIFNNLKASQKGRVAIISMDLVDAFAPKVQKDSLATMANCDPAYENLKNLLLGSVFLVENLDEVPQKQKVGDKSFVTLTGDVQTNVLAQKSGSKEHNIGIRVGLKDKLDRLAKKLESTESEIEKEQQNQQNLLEQIQKLNSNDIRNQLQQKDAEVRKLEQQLGSFLSSANLYQKSIDDYATQLKQLEESSEKAKQESEAILPQIDDINYELDKVLESQHKLRQKLREKEEIRQRALQSKNDAQIHKQKISTELEAYKRESIQSEESVKTIKERLEIRAEKARMSRESIRTLSAQADEMDIRLKELRVEKEQADKRLKEADEETGVQRGRLRGIEDEIRQLHRKKEINADLLHQYEIEQNKYEMQSKTLADHIWETYNVVLEQVTEQLPEDIEPGAVKETIINLRERLKSIGEVNHLAVEEYEEESERLEFYENQIADLKDAEQKLRQTIKDINETAHQRFSSTFNEIRENFKKVFSMLFREDDFCDLILEEHPDDPLNHKVEIIAKPRGKRPTNIEQLSGGEKTLTAIALLFAIYLVKPSPFCILDEVDAPLDDANVGRFANLIKEFSKNTQFIVITHNKKTMDYCEVLYGVTMQETGISKLVGVKLDTAENLVS